jgi:hypothetical protein
MKMHSLNSKKSLFMFICVAVFLLACPIKPALAAVNPDLLNQLDTFESLLKNAAGDSAQMNTLIQEKILLFPDDAAFIAAFASCCVPGMAADIAGFVAGMTPDLSIEIAFAVTYAVPDSAEKIKTKCTGISFENAAEISMAVEVAAGKSKSADLSNKTNKEIALAAVAAAEDFVEDLAVPAPAKGYGQ